MNRGIEGREIFSETADKIAFLDMLAAYTRKYRMRRFAYCVMDNHYHLVLQNASGRMSDYFRNLNTHYAFYYRKAMGGKGYVFQGRFHSTIIGDDDYLKLAIIYVLQNPMRAGMVKNYMKYLWSSCRMYTTKERPGWLDTEYVLDLFGGCEGLTGAVQAELQKKLPLLRTPFGPVMGEKSFIQKALERFERRTNPDPVKKKRRDDFYFEPVGKVIWEFEKIYKVKLENIDTGTVLGKRLRGTLLVMLKDLAGLKFREIVEFPIFGDLHYHSLWHLYKNDRKRWRDANT